MPRATDIPVAVRREVHARDGGTCRVCGAWANPPHLHHIVYRSQERNLHTRGNLITLCRPHHAMVHAHPRVFRPALEAVVEAPHLTALAWLRHQGTDIRGLMRGTL